MSRLAVALGHDDYRLLDRSLAALHDVVGVTSHDVTVLGELAQQVVILKQALKLDQADTTPYELYVSLRQRVVDDNIRLARALGINHENAVSEATPRIVAALKREYTDAQCFVPKATVLKKLLKTHTPKNVMKALRYRSIDSMLKHESPSHLIILSRYLEPRSWHDVYINSLAKFQAHDFEMRSLEVVWLDKLSLIEPLQAVAHEKHLVLHAKETGCVAVAPTSRQVIYGYTIRTIALLEHYVHENLYASSYAKVISTSKTFGKDYARSLGVDHEAHIRVEQYPLHWRSMHHAIAGAKIQDILPPHLSVDQWRVASANDRLRAYNDIVSFWEGFGHVITTADKPVSASVIDLSIDTSLESGFDTRSLKYARRALEQDVFRRYLQEPRVSQVVLHRLDLS